MTTSKRLTLGISIIILLSLCLCVTTTALVLSIITVENNVFSTGYVAINLNDGKPIIEDKEIFFQPGMTVKKDFFIENNSPSSVYYRLYFENVSGTLADYVEITIKDGENILYNGKVNELSRENASAVERELSIGEKITLTAYFRFPSEIGNIMQGASLGFDLSADAVQTKNNPNRLFD